MYLVGFIFVFGITMAMCLVVAIIKLIIAEVGVAFFATFLLIVSTLFLLVLRDKENEKL